MKKTLKRSAARGRPANPARGGSGKKASPATQSAQKSRRAAEKKAAKKLVDAAPHAARKRATPALETAPEQVPASAAIELVPWSKLHMSPFNDRARDPKQIEELAASIAVDGVLQNLTARPHPSLKGEYEIIMGGRRWLAARILVKAEKVGEDFPMPVRIREASDLQVLRLITVENIQRQDMHPLEEGRHFVKLRAAGDTTENIARLIGKSQKWVQMRIALCDSLAPKVQEEFQAGQLTLWQAHALTKAEPKRQAELLKQVKNGWIRTGEQLIRAATEGKPAVKAAHFKRELYDGAIIEDEDKVGGPWFDDVAQFERLQAEAIEATSAKLAEKWSGVQIVSERKDEYFHGWQWKPCKDPKKGVAVIVIGRDWKVAVHAGITPNKAEMPQAETRKVEKARQANGAAGAEKAESGPDPLTAPPAVTQPLMVYAKQQKTAAIQAAIVLAPGDDVPAGDGRPSARERGFKVALALTCMALMGDRTVCRIQPAEIRTDDQVRAPLLAAALAAFRPKLTDVLAPVARGKTEEETEAADLELIPFGYHDGDEGALPARAFDLLMALPLDEMQLLFAGLVAARSGSFNDWQPKLGDEALAQRVARELGLDMALAWGAELENWRAYLKLCKKSRLVRLVQHMPGLGLDPKEAVKMKTGVLAGAIEQALEAHPEQRNCVPPELRFGDKEGTEGLLASPAPTAASVVAAIADGAPAPAESPKPKKGRKRKIYDGTGVVREIEEPVVDATPEADPAAAAPEGGDFPAGAVFDDSAAAVAEEGGVG